MVSSTRQWSSVLPMISKPGANPTTPSYNASVVKIYNAMSSLVCFEIKNIFLYF
jgi:hypothetical protein